MNEGARIPFDVDLPSRYEVLRVIGRGGAAVVLHARDLRLQRDVAVKVFTNPDSSLEVLLDQEREAQLLARSSHPNLVTIYDVAVDRGRSGRGERLSLVMEFVDGPDLAQWLRVRRASAQQVAELGVALCSALQFVHNGGVLHCDIKPSNVLLQLGGDGELVPKLADFGIAAVLQGSVPQGEFTVGTAAYLSPEQVEGDPLRAPSDVYALGLVLLEAATGQVAFPGSVVESAFARLDRQPLIDTDLPDDLVTVLVGMTHREPSRRWSLPRARAAFRAALNGYATPDPSGGRAGDVTSPPGTPSVDTEAATPPLRTLGPEFRMAALSRAVEMAARTADAPGAFLLTTERGDNVLQTAYGLTPEAASELVERHRLLSSAPPSTPVGDAITATAVLGSRGDRLGVLVVTRAHRSDVVRRALHDTAFLIGQVLELRSATRRALLDR